MPHKKAKRSIREAEVQKKGFNLDPPSQPTSASAYADDTPRGGARILNSLAVRAAYRARKNGDPTPAAQVKGAKGAIQTSSPAGKLTKQAISTSSQPVAKPAKPASTVPKIIPGESLGDFNRRIESHMRPLVSQAIKSAQVKKSADEKQLWMEKKERRLEAKEQRKEAKARKESAESRKDADGSGDELKDQDSGETTVDRPISIPKEQREPGRKGPNGLKRPRADEADPSSDTERPTAKHPTKTFTNASSQTRRSINDIAHAPPVLPGLKRAPKAVKESEGKGAFQPTGRTPLNAGQARIMEEERERVIKRYREMKEVKRLEREQEKEAEARAKKAPKKLKTANGSS